jgi:hypothetical protein
MKMPTGSAPGPGSHPLALPHFLGIGAMRAGSTWLHYNLARHPSVWLPPLKEIHYFDVQRTGPFIHSYYWQHLRTRLRSHLKARRVTTSALRWDFNYFLRRRSDAWYQTIFTPARGQVAGEITPAYSVLDPATIADIRTLLPDLRVIFLMRNPVERTWSHLVKSLARRLDRHIREVPDAEILAMIDSDAVRSRSDYLATLANWEAAFPASQMLIGFMEEIHECPEALLRRIFTFLDVDPDDPAFSYESLRTRINTTQRHTQAIPEHLERHLYREYFPIIDGLHRRFGGYTESWHSKALRHT